MYYEGAFHDLRATFDQGVAEARASGSADSVWSTDSTLDGFRVPPPQVLTDQMALWPKLFRRVSTFFRENPKEQGLAQFPAWLQRAEDGLCKFREP